MGLQSTRVSILPGVSVLGLFKNLEYDAWFALAEFVDNSVASYQRFRHQLQKADGQGYALRVEIEQNALGHNSILIRDNAAGIHDPDYARAFRTAVPPPDQSGLSEFGIGLKAAASWFAAKWSVRTTALGEDVERFISFDVPAIVEEQPTDLPVEVAPAESNGHFTEVALTHLYQPLHPRTIGKAKKYLASIYRQLIDSGDLELTYDGEPLVYERPRILKAPYFSDPEGRAIKWEKNICLELPRNRRVTGWAGLRETGSTSEAGFALFRRGRLIMGAGDRPYRPEEIFRKPNSYTYQRLIGDFTLEGFEVSHTKSSIRWSAEEEAGFLSALRKELNAPPKALLSQAENYRARPRIQDVGPVAKTVFSNLATASDAMARDIASERQVRIANTPIPARLPSATPAPFATTLELPVDATETWRVDVEGRTEGPQDVWLQLSDAGTSKGMRHLTIRFALSHPFMRSFIGSNFDALEPIIRMGVAMAIAEVMARDAGGGPGAQRRFLNRLLQGAIAKTAFPGAARG